MNPFDLTAGPFLGLYILLLGLCVGWGVYQRRHDPRPSPFLWTGNLDEVEIAYLAGGPSRAIDAGIVGLFSAGAATFDARTRFVRPSPEGVPLSPRLDAFRSSLTRPTRVSDLGARLAPAIGAVEAALVARGLAFDTREARRIALQSGAPTWALVLFGLSRVYLGITRGHPVVFIGLLTGAAFLTAATLSGTSQINRKAGREAIRARRERYWRVMRAPMAAELPLAVALAGPRVLAGTPYAAFGGFRGASGGDGGGGCGGGGGGGDGGGGCGGCGH